MKIVGLFYFFLLVKSLNLYMLRVLKSYILTYYVHLVLDVYLVG